jgi:hypothetical protein
MKIILKDKKCTEKGLMTQFPDKEILVNHLLSNQPLKTGPEPYETTIDDIDDHFEQSKQYACMRAVVFKSDDLIEIEIYYGVQDAAPAHTEPVDEQGWMVAWYQEVSDGEVQRSFDNPSDAIEFAFELSNRLGL